MNDLRIIITKTILPTHSVAPIRDFYPSSVIVLGNKMSLAQEVEYNGVLVSEFVVADPNRLIVRIPSTQVGRPLSSLRVFSSVSLAKQDAAVSFGLTRPLRTVQGIDRLVQGWLMIFMSTPGSDVFDMNSGGGGRALIGRSTDRSNNSVAADLGLAIARTQQEMLRLQSKTPSIPLDEKLLSSSLDAVRFDDRSAMLLAQVSISNMAGNQAQVSLGG